jgi:hypothetical protein
VYVAALAAAALVFVCAFAVATALQPGRASANGAAPPPARLPGAALFEIELPRIVAAPVERRRPAVRHARRIVRPKPRKPPRPQNPRPPSRPRTTASLYERTTAPALLHEQGCRAGRQRTSGLVILDFGRLAVRPGGYGTITFSDRWASNTSITWALRSYARGYVRCLPRRSTASITLVRGTSNYFPTVPSTYAAGRLWARETIALADWLRVHHYDVHVKAAAGDDAEPAWDRSFRRTYDFFRGYRAAAHGHLLYNYGSLDGGAGAIWNVRQAYYVAAGMRYARAVPEIYNRAMAREWAYLSRIVVERYGKPLTFAGLMTQHMRRCRRCGFTAAEAHDALVGELARSPRTRVRVLAAVTNIGSPAPPRRR